MEKQKIQHVDWLKVRYQTVFAQPPGHFKLKLVQDMLDTFFDTDILQRLNITPDDITGVLEGSEIVSGINQLFDVSPNEEVQIARIKVKNYFFFICLGKHERNPQGGLRIFYADDGQWEKCYKKWQTEGDKDASDIFSFTEITRT